MVFQDCICFQLGRVTRKLTRYYRDKISVFGLTHGQFFMLVAIFEEKSLLPSQLAEKTALDRPTTTGLLDRLERDGWIERRPDSNDRRALRIHLSPKAEKNRNSILSIFGEINSQFVNRYSKEEWQQFQSLLQKLE
ncbi:MAG: MarR family transcriptional regulator [Thermodesulfobacteriota bacterium]|nr:MarR family transcriptional regulator [Thermodesulfobacteriota bacterium]